MATIEATNPTHLSATTMAADPAMGIITEMWVAADLTIGIITETWVVAGLAMEIITEMWVVADLATPISQKATANLLATLAVAVAAHSNTERTCKQCLY